MEKSHVTMEQKVCVVCGKIYDTGAILLDKRLQPRFEMHTVTGRGMCEEHERLKKEGYIALVGIDPERSMCSGEIIHDQNAYRTGAIIHIKKEAFKKIFNKKIPAGMVAFADQAAINAIKRMVKK